MFSRVTSAKSWPDITNSAVGLPSPPTLNFPPCKETIFFGLRYQQHREQVVIGSSKAHGAIHPTEGKFQKGKKNKKDGKRGWGLYNVVELLSSTLPTFIRPLRCKRVERTYTVDGPNWLPHHPGLNRASSCCCWLVTRWHLTFAFIFFLFFFFLQKGCRH